MKIHEENKPEFIKTNLLTWLNSGYTGKRNTIVVLDDRAFPLESDNVIEPFPDNTEKVFHKTSVCSVIRAMQPDAKIVAFSWFGSKKKEIIDWIFEHKEEIDAINCSFSGTVQIDEFKRLEGLDIPIFCASGNSPDGVRIDKVSSPAKFDFCIAVGAWEEARDKKADYSMYGKELDIVAYTDIYIPTLEEGLKKFSGTSCATPVATSLYSAYVDWRKSKKFPKLTRQQAYDFVTSNTMDKLAQGFDIESGFGLFVLPKEIPDVKEEDVMPKDYFNDDNNRWSEEFNNELARLGILEGDGQGNFRPKDNVTREELSKVAVMLRKNILDEVRTLLENK